MKKQLLALSFLTLPFLGFSQNVAKPETKENQTIGDIMNRKDLPLSEIKLLAETHFNKVGRGKGSGHNQYQRWLYEAQFHLDANGFLINAASEQNAYEQFLQSSGGANQKMMLAPVGTWNQLGPFTWNRTSGWNPGNGRLTAMAIHPSATNTIYVGSPGGGLWKTTNGGSTWQPLTDGNALWMHIYSIAIDPANQSIVYAGTGNSANQVIKSTNGGSSWTVLGSGPTGEIRKLLIHPTNSSIILAAASNGIWRTTNSGTNWTRVYTSYIEDLEFKPNDPNVVYASGNVVAKSTNNGATWTTLGSAQGITGTDRTLLAVSPNNANYVYAVQASGSIFGKLYLSTDAGVSFTTKITGSTSANNFFGYNTNGVDTRGQAWYDMAICASPSNAAEVHIAGIITWKSTNSGSSFVATTEWSLPNSTGYTHSDMHGLEFVGNTIYSLSDGGIYKSTDYGDNWTNISVGLSIRQFYRMASGSNSATVFTGGAQDNGSVTRNSSSVMNDWLGADGMEGLVSPTNASNIWGTSQYGQLYRSTDGGSTRSNMYNFNANWITPIAIHPTNETILFGGGAGVFKSTNSGSTFSKISGTTISSNLDDIAIAPSNANYIYASVGNSLYVTTNGGTNWSTYTAPGSISDICVSPSSPSKIWITTTSGTGRVYVSTNSGSSFTNISGSLPSIAARTIVVDNTTSENLFVGMNIGVYTYSNGDPTWTDISSNLPKVAVNELDLQLASNKLRVATYGRGIWEYVFPTSSCVNAYEANGTQSTAAAISIGTSISAAIASSTDLDFYKVTTSGKTNMTVNLSNLPADFDAEIINSSGTVLASGTNGSTTSENFTASGIAAGTYTIKVFGYNGANSNTVCYNLLVSTVAAPAAPGNGGNNNTFERIAKKSDILYPNPAQSLLTVDLSSIDDVSSVIMMNLEGRVVMRRDQLKTEDKTLLFDVSNLSPGIYHVQILSVNSELKNLRFVKE
jgi:hypothetical protein